MASVQGKTSIKIDELVNGTVISGSVSSAGDLLLTTRGGAVINAGSVRKPFGVTWASTTAYVTGDVVGYAGSLWKAKSDNTGKAPALFTSFWTPLSGFDVFDWSEKDPYFDGDLASECWQFFWKSGNPVVTLSSAAGEFESGYQALRIALAASENQRFYQKTENITRGGEVLTMTVRARLLSAAAGSYLQGIIMQNDGQGKPEPFETGSVSATANEGNQSLTTSWADYTFTYTAVAGKPRASLQLVAVAGSGAPATFLIDRVKVFRGKGQPISKVDADALYLPKYQEYDSGWIYIGDGNGPAFQNGTGPYGNNSNHAIPRFRKIGDLVFLEGLVGNPPAANGVIFTLPAGFRPDGNIIPAGFGNGGTEGHACQIMANGNVVSGTSVSGWAAINCVFVAAGAATTWHTIGAAGEPAFGAGWSNVGGGWQTGRYCKIGEYLYLDGVVQRTTGTGVTIFTLPAGYIPQDGNTHTPVAAQGTNMGGDDYGINVNTTGVVAARAKASSTGWVSLSGVRIYVGSATDSKWHRFRGGADGWYNILGPYGSGWPTPGIRRDGKIIHINGLANFASTGVIMKLPFAYAPGQCLIFPVVCTLGRRVDVDGPNEDYANSVANSISNTGTGVHGFTNSWVVAEAFEGDIRRNS